MKKRNKKVLSGSVIGIIIVIILILFGNNPKVIETISKYTNIDIKNTVNVQEAEKEQFIAQDNLIVDYIDVGQADSILAVNKDKVMLIDAGTNEAGEKVVSYLKNKGIKKIDYLIGTHPHEDHIGGMDDVIKNFDIGQIYMPKIETTTKTFEDVLNAIQEKSLNVVSPEKGTVFELGQAKCEFMTEPILDKENLNLSSLVIRLDFGNNSFLFMGDAEKQNEISTIWRQVDVLKVGHHGSETSSSNEFLNQVKPKYAIIMVGEGNSYNLPKPRTINDLEEIGAQIYRTDLNGNIEIKSDGNEIKIVVEK